MKSRDGQWPCAKILRSASIRISAYMREYAHYPHHSTFPASTWPSLFKSVGFGQLPPQVELVFAYFHFYSLRYLCEWIVCQWMCTVLCECEEEKATGSAVSSTAAAAVAAVAVAAAAVVSQQQQWQHQWFRSSTQPLHLPSNHLSWWLGAI